MQCVLCVRLARVLCVWFVSHVSRVQWVCKGRAMGVQALSACSAGCECVSHV